MKILALELSGALGSIAFLPATSEPIVRQFASDRKSSGLFFENLESLWIPNTACDLIVVGLGPGSYAGVRVAISTAIGLRFSSGAKLIGLPSICALPVGETAYQVIGDARRESFFHALIRDGRCEAGPSLHTRDELSQKLLEADALPVYATKNLPQFPHVTVASPSAFLLARLAETQANERPDSPTLEPIYLREPQITMPARPGRLSP